MTQFQIFSVITTSLNQLGIKYSVETPNISLVGQYMLSNGRPGGIWFKIVVLPQYVVCYSGYTSQQVYKTWNLLRLIDMLNVGMILGNFEFESSSNILRYKYGLPWSAFSNSQIETVQVLVQIPVNMCDRCLGAISNVVNGGDPNVAIQGGVR